MKSLALTFSVLFFMSFSISQAETQFKGNADTWWLYLTDNFSTVSVIEVYDQANCDDVSGVEPRYIAFGKEREKLNCTGTQCCIERILRGNEVIAERIVSSGENGVSTKDVKTGDTLLHSFGLRSHLYTKHFNAFVDGDFRYHIMNSRTLYGSKRYQFQLTDLYAEKDFSLGQNSLRSRLGRQSLAGGIIIDGFRADWLWAGNQNQSLGAVFGFAPDPRSKNFSHERLGFGIPFQFIPSFSEKSKTKLLIDANLYAESFKGSLNRFSLFSRSHFTPTPELSLFHYSQIELPAPKETSISSSHFSLRGFYRPDRKWMLSIGLSQFRIDRYLVASSVQYLTDNGSLQSERVGDRLDRSDRYRVDARVSYKVNSFVQPYIAGRYERRTFDSDKIYLNPAPEEPATAPKEEDLRLINKKNAYGGDLGFRSFWPKNIDADSRFSFHNRYQSRFYSFNQNLSWIPSEKWAVDAGFQIFRSTREIPSSLSTLNLKEVKSLDYYLNLGASYRFRSNILGQISYDFLSEDDAALKKNIYIHSLLLRFDYRF